MGKKYHARKYKPPKGQIIVRSCEYDFLLLGGIVKYLTIFIGKSIKLKYF